jgi:hypothetical protein
MEYSAFYGDRLGVSIRVKDRGLPSARGSELALQGEEGFLVARQEPAGSLGMTGKAGETPLGFAQGMLRCRSMHCQHY